MSKRVKYIIVALIAVLVTALVTIIAMWSASFDPENPEPGLYIDGNRIAQPGALITVGGYEVPFDEFRYHFLSAKSFLEMYMNYQGSSIDWSVDPDGDKVYALLRTVEDEIVNKYVWLQIAGEMGITLAEDELAQLQTEFDTNIAEKGEAQYLRELQAQYYSDFDLYKLIARQQQLVSKARTAYTEQLREENATELGAQADADFRAGKMTAKHILIMVDGTAADAQQAQADALARAEELYSEITDSENPQETFDALMNEFSEDGGLATNPDGYTFGEGEMVDIFYQTAKGLAVNEIAPPVFSNAENYQGYHIIMRMPLDESGMPANRDSAITARVNELATEKQTQATEQMTVAKSDYYLQLRANSII